MATGCAFAQISSRGEACNVLLKEAALRHLAAKESPDGYYDCQPESDADSYIILGLHYRLKSQRSAAGSNLVGWYAVDKSNGQLYEWDMANQRIGDVVGLRGKRD